MLEFKFDTKLLIEGKDGTLCSVPDEFRMSKEGDAGKCLSLNSIPSC